MNLQTQRKATTGGPNWQSSGQMLPVFHKHHAMIKEKLDNERMEKSSL